jgi:hypothetical protein
MLLWRKHCRGKTPLANYFAALQELVSRVSRAKPSAHCTSTDGDTATCPRLLEPYSTGKAQVRDSLWQCMFRAARDAESCCGSACFGHHTTPGSLTPSVDCHAAVSISGSAVLLVTATALGVARFLRSVEPAPQSAHRRWPGAQTLSQQTVQTMARTLTGNQSVPAVCPCRAVTRPGWPAGPTAQTSRPCLDRCCSAPRVR